MTFLRFLELIYTYVNIISFLTFIISFKNVRYKECRHNIYHTIKEINVGIKNEGF